MKGGWLFINLEDFYLNFFILYDFNDNFICYFDNIKELKRYLPNYRIRDIRRRFLKSSKNYINVIVLGNVFKLYTFNDKDLIYI